MVEEKLMKLLGSRITKVSGERNPDFDGKISMKSDINISSIEKFKPEGVKQESLKVKFSFKVDYSDLGSVLIEGLLFVTTDTKTQKDLLRDWKDKKFDSPENMAVMNMILQKSSIKAFELEEELGLPIHIQLPLLQRQKKD
jgi:hypothetical protein